MCIGNALRGLGFAFEVMTSPRFEETREVTGGVASPANKYGKVVCEATLGIYFTAVVSTAPRIPAA